MRSTRRKMLLPALLAVLALSAVAASAAQAATPEGPFYKIAGSRLLSGKTEEVKAKMVNALEMSSPADGWRLSCTKAAFSAGAKLLGSTGANSGSGEMSLEFSGCRLGEGNGAPDCHLASSEGGSETTTIKTQPLKLEPAYTTGTRSGSISAILVPVKGANKAFAVMYFGGACEVKTAELAGSTAGLVRNGKSEDIVGAEPKAAKTLELAWPATSLKEAWLESNDALTDAEFELVWWGYTAVVHMNLSLELANGAEWGVFT